MIRLKTLVTVVIAICLVPTWGAMAQVPGGGSGGRAGGGFPQSGAREVTNINFSGGNLAEYYEHLQQHTGVRNIILNGDELERVMMPEVRLSTVLFADAVELPYFLAVVPEGYYLNISMVGSSKSIFIVGIEESAVTTVSDPVRRPISFAFAGGSLQEFVATVQMAAGTQRILVRGDAASFEMPPLQLDNVTLRGVLLALDGDERRSQSGERSRISVDERDGVYLVEVQAERLSRQSQEDLQIRTVSWSLASLRGPGRLSIQEMLTAIEVAVQVGGNADTTTIRFHDETSLLIVSAQPRGIATIDGVLRELRRSSDEAFGEHQRLMEQRNELEGMRANEVRLERTIERIEQQIEQINTGIDPHRKAVIHLIEEQLRRHQGQLDELRYEMQALEDRIHTSQGS